MPKALKSNPKCKKSPNLVTLIAVQQTRNKFQSSGNKVLWLAVPSPITILTNQNVSFQRSMLCYSKICLPITSAPVDNVIKQFWRQSRFSQNLQIENSLFWCLNQQSNVQTMLFSSKTILLNSIPILLLLFQLKGKSRFSRFAPNTVL